MSRYLFAEFGLTVLTMFGLGHLDINSVSALTITYDAGLDFSTTENPNGVWSYGKSNSLSNTSAFTVFDGITTPGTDFGVWVTFVDGGETFVPYPYVNANLTDENITTFVQDQLNIIYEPDKLYLHSSTSNEQGYAIVRWISPYFSDYSINTFFEAKGQLPSNPPSVDVFVYLNGSQLHEDFLFGGLDNSSFNTDLSLNEGDILDFIVGSPNTNNNDVIELDVSITTTLSVPEPSTMIGLGLLTTISIGSKLKLKKK